MRVFFDTNVIMDTMIEGRPSSEASRQIAQLAKLDVIRISISALSIADAVYSCRKLFDHKAISTSVDAMRKTWRVLKLDEYNIFDALRSDCPDFEDALQISIAEGDCDVIVTNNTKHFKGHTALEVCTPGEFLARVSAG